jgi:RHS repeat-associated protein
VELDGRTVSGGHRFGYQGSEKDDDVKGNGNSYTTEFRQLDPRLGRWLSVDPLSFKFPWQSTYTAFDNNPISLVDRLGSETEGGPGDGYKKNKDGSRSKTNANGTKTYDAPGFSSVNLPANAKVLGTMQDVDGNKDGAIYNNGVKYQASVGDLAKFEVNDVTYTAQFSKGIFKDYTNEKGQKYLFTSNDVASKKNQVSGEDQSALSTAIPLAVACAAADGPVPVGEIVAVGVLAGAATYDLTQKKYITYTLSNSKGQVYVGRASGFGSPQSILMNRFSGHHMRSYGYSHPQIDKVAQSFPIGYYATRGREQDVVNGLGGIGSPKLGNSINPIWEYNPNRSLYMFTSNLIFGPYVR